MVSDSELIGRLREFLRNSDLDTTTTGIVRRKLEEDFGVDLSDKKAFIREQVDLFLQSQFENEEGDVDNDDDQAPDVKSEETDGSVSKEDSGDEEEEEEEGEEEEATASNGKSNAKRGSSINSISVYHC